MRDWCIWKPSPLPPPYSVWISFCAQGRPSFLLFEGHLPFVIQTRHHHYYIPSQIKHESAHTFQIRIFMKRYFLHFGIHVCVDADLLWHLPLSAFFLLSPKPSIWPWLLPFPVAVTRGAFSNEKKRREIQRYLGKRKSRISGKKIFLTHRTLSCCCCCL